MKTSLINNNKKDSFQENNFEILSLLFDLVSKKNKVSAIFLIRNRQPVMTSSPIAFIDHYISDQTLFVSAKFPIQFKYIDYPEFEKAVYLRQITRIEPEDRSKEIISEIGECTYWFFPVFNEKYSWGAIVFALPKREQLKDESSVLIELQSKVIAINFKSILDRELQDFKLNNVNGKLRQKANAIEKVIKKYNKGEAEMERESGQIQWSDFSEMNEVWISLQGYRLHQKDPVISKWIRLDESEIDINLVNLFYAQTGEKFS